jgi:hypothetical protein
VSWVQLAELRRLNDWDAKRPLPDHPIVSHDPHVFADPEPLPVILSDETVIVSFRGRHVLSTFLGCSAGQVLVSVDNVVMEHDTIQAEVPVTSALNASQLCFKMVGTNYNEYTITTDSVSM